MSLDESRRELVFGDGGRQKLRDPCTQKVLLQDLAHARPSRGILDEHVGQQVFEVLRISRGDLRVLASQDFQYKTLHGVCVESMA